MEAFFRIGRDTTGRGRRIFYHFSTGDHLPAPRPASHFARLGLAVPEKMVLSQKGPSCAWPRRPRPSRLSTSCPRRMSTSNAPWPGSCRFRRSRPPSGSENPPQPPGRRPRLRRPSCFPGPGRPLQAQGHLRRRHPCGGPSAGQGDGPALRLHRRKCCYIVMELEDEPPAAISCRP
jgi:hypothetical protein